MCADEAAEFAVWWRADIVERLSTPSMPPFWSRSAPHSQWSLTWDMSGASSFPPLPQPGLWRNRRQMTRPEHHLPDCDAITPSHASACTFGAQMS